MPWVATILRVREFVANRKANCAREVRFMWNTNGTSIISLPKIKPPSYRRHTKLPERYFGIITDPLWSQRYL
jgi:hypothetical protein